MTEIYDWTAGPACIASFPPKMFDDRTAGKTVAWICPPQICHTKQWKTALLIDSIYENTENVSIFLENNIKKFKNII